MAFAFALSASGAAEAARLADCVTRGGTPPGVTAQQEALYRGQHYALHMARVGEYQAELRLNGGLLIDYVQLTYRRSWTEYLLGQAGHFGTPVVPGTEFYDLSDRACRRALVDACSTQVARVGTDGIMLDTPLECAPGQEWLAVELCDEVAAALGPKLSMPNFGDLWTWSGLDPLSPAHALAQSATAQFCQVAQNVGSDKFRLASFTRMVTTVALRAAEGRTLVVGILDPDGRNPQAAADIIASSPSSSLGRVYWFYETAGMSDLPLWDWQWCKALPDPFPPPQVLPTGLLADMTARPSVYFPADNWWNLDVRTAPVDPSSASIISFVKGLESTGGRLHPDFTPDYGIPYAVVDAATPLVPVTFGNASESDVGAPGLPSGYPIPVAATTNARYLENAGRTDGDRHLLMLDRDRMLAFELSYAQYANGGWSAGYGAVFDVRTNYRRPEGWTSTDAAGLCVLAGLVRYDEVYGPNPIRHATRCSIRRINGYVWPASHRGSSDAGAPPLGMRIRLKATFDTSRYPAPLRKLLDSWKVYGLIVADRGGNMYVQGTMDARWDNSVLNPAFHSLHVTDFEVIRLGWGKP